MSEKKRIKVALSGNPNSGKSTLFNALTGARQHIANYPGVTVEKKSGFITHRGYEIELVDLPGTYSLSAYSVEEQVARNFVIEESPDIVVEVVDASNLERNLYLFVQFLELGCPLILALNMMDMAKARGIHIEVERLSQYLGVRVVPMTARAGEGIEELLDAIVQEAGKEFRESYKQISYGRDVDNALAQMEALLKKGKKIPAKYPRRWLALKFLEGDSIVCELLKGDGEIFERITAISAHLTAHTMDTLGEDPESVIVDQRYGFIASVVRHCVRREIENRLNLSDRMDRVLTNRLIGPIFMLFVLYALYLIIFWVSESPVSWLETAFGLLRQKAQEHIQTQLLRSLVTSGVIDGVGGIMGYMPLIFFMFGAIAVLEDSGYMARIAYMMDRLMRFFGLHGSSVIALIVSGGIS
ncbi:MAG: ferrous iron transport protein B, partial [Desulfatiglandales bacterium]